MADSAQVTGVLETSLYVTDVERSKCFYQSLFGFESLLEDERLCALAVDGKQVLLLFRKQGSVHSVVIPGGMIPGHDGSGEQHMAFSIAASQLQPWRNRLQERGIAIESTVRWPRGGESLYFRDPDNHLIELATPGVWSIY
ncbi:MAG TPA: VOC family protein [Bryobacteraceae bacterium]|nr:VOC family protein [Bryobacteraceae bacterium]